ARSPGGRGAGRRAPGPTCGGRTSARAGARRQAGRRRGRRARARSARPTGRGPRGCRPGRRRGRSLLLLQKSSSPVSLRRSERRCVIAGTQRRCDILLAMGRPKLHGEATAGALLETAERIVDSEGLEALTVRRVAEGAGTSTRAVYSVYGSKDGL